MKNMKFNLLALLFIGLMAGCGNSQPTPSNNTFGQNAACNPYSGVPCYNTGGTGYLPPGVSSYNTPLYATSGVSFSGSQIQVALGSVNAGDQIVASGMSSLALYKNCSNGWASFNMGQSLFPLYSPALAVNGTPIPYNYSGLFTAPASGILTLLATSVANSSCVGNLSPMWSVVSYNGYNSPIAYIRRCMNTSGAIVPCQ